MKQEKKQIDILHCNTIFTHAVHAIQEVKEIVKQRQRHLDEPIQELQIKKHNNICLSVIEIMNQFVRSIFSYFIFIVCFSMLITFLFICCV